MSRIPHDVPLHHYTCGLKKERDQLAQVILKRNAKIKRLKTEIQKLKATVQEAITTLNT